MLKTAKGLVEYAKAQLGRPYWYGTFGQAASKELYEQKKRQYPKQYTWDYDGITAKVHDCVGLIKGYLWCEDAQAEPVYNEEQDVSADMLYAICETGGRINTIPEIPGVLVFKSGHVGIYVCNGEVIEARGRSYGVVKTKLSDRPWTDWAFCPWIEYEAEKKNVSIDLPVLKKGAKGDSVRAMQTLLLGYGYKMINKSGKEYGVDGSFGGATKRALEKFQAENGLEVDASCGRKTWTKLLGME